MGIDSVRAALQVVTGAGELTRTKALEAAGSLLAIPVVGPTAARATQAAGQVSTLADELIAAAAANREMVRDLVRQEMESQLQRLGLGTASELGSLRDEIDRLRVDVARLQAAGTDAASGARSTAPAKKAAKRAPAKKTAAHTAPARKTAAKAPAKTTSTKKAVTKKAAKTTPARKATNG